MWMVLTALVVTTVSVVAVGGLLIVRRTQRLQRHLGENDVAGILFGAVGILYGALLAFVVFATWEGYSRAEQAVTMEAADLVAVYRDTQQFPTPLRQDIQGALRTYANQVMATEWESHGNLLVHTTPDLLNSIWDLYRQVDPSTPRGETQLAAANERLHEIELQRHLRHLAGEATLPPVFWPVLVVGGVIVVLFSYGFHQNKLPVQAGMTALLAGLLMLVILLIYSLDLPFTGPVAVSQQPLRHALAQFDAIDLQAPPAIPVEAPELPSAKAMVKVGAGTYQVGRDSPGGNYAPVQSIAVNDFWIDQYEVTNVQYAEFLSATKGLPPASWVGEAMPAGLPDFPVEGVTWDQAAAFCKWAGKRLPSEAEWEIAARGKDGSLYPWGNDEQLVVLPDNKTYAVGKIPANRSAFGVFDMAGNVWEWVGDPYAPVAAGQRVLRGGSYGFLRDMAYRLQGDPNVRSMFAMAGIRCAADHVREGG
jgi:formylglycine-generating enzyme required for sulfatase activity